MAQQPGKKPSISWIEGLVDYFRTKCPYGANDPRRLGYAVGKQIIGLYITELLLQYALDNSGKTYKHDHNLHALFMKLPRQQRRAVERKYKKLLNSNTKHTFDVFMTAEAFLKYLGKNAITATRYFWQPTPGRYLADHASILFTPRDLYNLIYALFIELHNYPSKPIPKRYETTYASLDNSLKKDANAMAHRA